MAMDAQSSFLAEFNAFVAELTTPERRNILALTEIARDALANYPAAAASLAAAPVPQKLPVFYLLDSIAKNVGEPYKSYFASNLADVFCNTWQLGGPSLQPALEKLLGTWVGVFPQPALNDAHARLAQMRAAAPSGYGGYSALAPAYAPAPAPMVQDPRLVGVQYPQQQPYAQQPYQQPAPAYGAGGWPYGGGAAGAAPYAQPPPAQPPPYGYAQPPPAYQAPYGQPAAPAPLPALQQPQLAAPLPELLNSLVTAGLLPGASTLAPQQSSSVPATPPYAGATTASPAPEQPPSVEFTPERIKERNPSAVARLLRVTEATKSRFLDRKFLRRQRPSLKESRLWYVDLDTWMASTTSGGGQQQQQQQQGGTAGAAPEPAPECSTPVDDAQTHCALSGERFEQFWDEDHQEWRYRGARRLDAEEAAACGLQEGAIVLVSALAAPAAAGALQGLKEEEQVAAELAAAAEGEAEGEPLGAGAAAAQPAAAPAGAGQAPPLVGAKHERDEPAAEAVAPQQQQTEKRVKLEPVAAM
eukprot:scaffold20.g7891.t1